MNPLKEMAANRKSNNSIGIPSYCSSNDLVIETLLERARETGKPVLIEATANQVNQYGGYTNMVPVDFRHKVLEMAREAGVPRSRVMLGGDHLGPLIWQNESAASAMEKAVELVYQFARAGYTKIHLDTSMKLADDGEGRLATETIAQRGLELYNAAMRGYRELCIKEPDAKRPVFVIGSEVPVPGGAQETEEDIVVTTPEAFVETVTIYQKVFEEAKEDNAWKDIIAVVVQPGVEFGDAMIHHYNREAAKELCTAKKNYENLVFEGHSTDYQTKKGLRQMVEDGIAILKVGPALTFALREGLFALSEIEAELIPEEQRACSPAVLERRMLEKPNNWSGHYHGNYQQQYIARKYSFSDRCRYYFNDPDVMRAQNKLFENLSKNIIPISMLHQYMPMQYRRVLSGELPAEPKKLAMDFVKQIVYEYEYATDQKQ